MLLQELYAEMDSCSDPEIETLEAVSSTARSSSQAQREIKVWR